MHVSPFLAELVLLIGAAALGVALFQRLRLPAVAGFLVAGALIGPGTLGLISDPEAVLALAEFGVVFLLFEIGLEIPVDRLRRSWRLALGAGGLQVAGTLAAGAGLAFGFGLPGPTSVLVGMLLAMSSTAVVMRLLAERGELDAPHGQLAVGVLLFQDLCIVPFLLSLPLLASGASGESLSVGAIGVAVARALAALVVFTLAARFALPFLLDRVARLGSRDLFSLVAVLVVVGGAVAAEAMGLTLAVGAFLAGITLSASPYGAQLFAEVLPLRGVLLGIFFTAVGMLLDPAAAWAEADLVLLFLAGAVALKALLVFAAVVGPLRQGVRVAVLTALALAQTGEFSFVLAREALEAGLLPDGLGDAFVGASVLSLLATPFLVRAAPAVATWLARGRAGGVETEGPTAPGDAVVIIGYGLTGRTLGRVLSGLGVPWLAVEANAASVHEARTRDEHVVFGDATRVALLEHVGVRRARAVAVAVTDPLATREVVKLVRQLNPRAPLFARTRYVLEVDRLASAGADHVVADEVEGTLDLLAQVLRAQGIPAGSVERFLAELREEGYGLLQAPPELGLDPWLVELLEGITTEWVEATAEGALPATLGDLGLRPRTGATVLAVERGSVTTPSPGPERRLEPGDRLLLFGTREAVERASHLLAPPSGGDVP